MVMKPKYYLAFIVLALVTLAGCGGGASSEAPSLGGGSTIARAGSDAAVDEGATVTLSGSGSDSGGTVSSYAWTQVSGPPVLISPSNTASLTILTPQVTQDQVIVLRLTITGSTGSTAFDEVQITVRNVIRTSGTISGKVINGLTGAELAGANVVVAGTSTTSDASGEFSVTTAVGDRIPVTVSLAGYANQQKITSLTSDRFEDYITVRILPISQTTTFTPSTDTTLTVPGTAASITILANSLATSTGGAPVGNVTAYFTLIDPRNDPEVMPGDYLGNAGSGALQNMESMGAISIIIFDSTGAALNLLNGTSATVHIPALARGTSTPPATIPLFDYDASIFNWVEQGTATLVSDVQPYYMGTISELGIWGAATEYPPIDITGCVKDEFGIPVFSARITSSGDNYNGTAIAYTETDGTFAVHARQNSRVFVNASNSTSVSNTVSVQTTTNNASISQCLLLGRAQATVKLTWGSSPSDLDSHLFTPTNAHVYYASPGSLTQTPFAALDVDDVTSYGPEVVTISQLAAGQYRYYVHNFSGTFSPGQTASPARVELRISGRTHIFAPPAGEGANLWWHVFDLTVGSGGAVSVTTVGTWDTSSPTGLQNTPQKNYIRDKNMDPFQ